MTDRENQLLFVQFLHPGGEHRPDPNNPHHIDWNRGAHQRKFIKNSGVYLEGDRPIASELIFWGEWEPQSNVIQRLKASRTGEPKYLSQPYCSVPQQHQFLQNTDPFVFGDSQKYKLTRDRNIQQLWQQVKDRVEQTGLKLGIHTELPPARLGNFQAEIKES